MEKIYTMLLVKEIHKEIKKEIKKKKEIFFFIKLYVKAMKIVEKEEEENYKCFCKKNKKKIIDFSDYLIKLHKIVLQRILFIHCNKKYIFL